MEQQVIDYYKDYLTVDEIAACTGLSTRYVRWILEKYLGHQMTE